MNAVAAFNCHLFATIEHRATQSNGQVLLLPAAPRLRRRPRVLRRTGAARGTVAVATAAAAIAAAAAVASTAVTSTVAVAAAGPRLHVCVLKLVGVLVLRDEGEQRYGPDGGVLPGGVRHLRLQPHLPLRAPRGRRQQHGHLHRRRQGPQAALPLPPRRPLSQPVRRSAAHLDLRREHFHFRPPP